MRGRKPGGRKSGGRKKGTPNKFTRVLKEVILEALARKGGVRYLERQADRNPVAFLQLIGKVLPLQMKQAGDEPIVPAPVIHEHIG